MGQEDDFKLEGWCNYIHPRRPYLDRQLVYI